MKQEICKCGHKENEHQEDEKNQDNLEIGKGCNYQRVGKCTCKKFEPQGCGRRFFVKRFGNGYIIKPNEPEYLTTKKEIIVCGNNFSKALCPNCKPKNHSQEGCGKVMKSYIKKKGDMICGKNGSCKECNKLKNHSQQDVSSGNSEKCAHSKPIARNVKPAGANAKPGGVKPTDFNLSEKITLFALFGGKQIELFRPEDIKEFIKRLKATRICECGCCGRNRILIDKLSGEELSK